MNILSCCTLSNNEQIEITFHIIICFVWWVAQKFKDQGIPNYNFNGGHPVVRHNTIIYKYLRQYTTILVTNVTLFCSWRHVSAD